MKYRKLRIAWSVAWGVVAVLLCRAVGAELLAGIDSLSDRIPQSSTIESIDAMLSALDKLVAVRACTSQSPGFSSAYMADE